MLRQAPIPAAEVPEWMRFTVALLAGLVVYTAVMFVQHLRAVVFPENTTARRSGFNGLVTIGCSLLVGALVVWVMSHAQITYNMVFIEGAPPLRDLDFASKLMLALGFSSVAPVVAQFIKSRDNNDTARTPSIVPKNPPEV